MERRIEERIGAPGAERQTTMTKMSMPATAEWQMFWVKFSSHVFQLGVETFSRGRIVLPANDFKRNLAIGERRGRYGITKWYRIETVR